MKRKILVAILAVACAFAGAFGLVACENSSGSSDKWGNVYTAEAAYAYAKELGYGGTLEEFIASISGKDGKDGKDGEAGKDGKDGKDGEAGADGLGVKSAHVNSDGELILVLTDESTVNCGKVNEENEQLKYTKIKQDGDVVAYSVSGIGLVSDTDVVIPSTYKNKPVIAIGDSAFTCCFNLTSVTIPEGVTSIGNNAFDGCIGLTSITIPDGLTSIGDYAFYDCEKLTSIIIPDSVTEIGDGAFRGCNYLPSIIIPETVNYMGESVFSAYYMTIYCKAAEKPTGWNEDWAGSGVELTVVWGYNG